MRIKTLQITGFKSFVDKTVFRFDEGITAIVGPNGCGKSNVVDAMRWAMGEQAPRRLRGKGMEDVIFAGAEGRAPVGMAEVVLTFDNSDGLAPGAYASFNEIQISRRLYRSGESEYLINKTGARLRDVLDFFRDTGIGTRGYTIVEQGQIGAIVSAKPDDRRLLIEEAAGISKYKARRQEAERKMQSTEQNLVRVNDVLAEIRRQINGIERQARKAARYKRLRSVVRALELSLARDERGDLLAAAAEANQTLAGLRDGITGLETRLAEHDAGLEQQRLSLTERERVLNQGSEALYAVRGRIKEIEGRSEFERRERESLLAANERRRGELAELSGQLERALEQGRENEQASEVLARTLAEEDAAIAQAEDEVRSSGAALRELETEREASNRAMVDVLTRIARIEDRQAALDDRRAEIDQRLRSSDMAIEAQQSEAQQAATQQHHLEDGLRNLLSERDRLMQALREALERHERCGEDERDSVSALRAVSAEHEARRARLDSLREVVEAHEDVGAGARHLLEQSDAAGAGLLGIVREVIEADREIEPAVEAVLAERAEAIVARDAQAALGALEALRGAQAGRATLFLEPPPEVVDGGLVPMGQPLIDRVRAREGFEGVARALLGSVQLVDDLDEVMRIYGRGRIPATFVTPRGELITPSGFLSGGGDSAGTGLLARMREVRELESQVKTLGARVAEAEAAHRGARTAFEAAREEVENLRNRHHTAALAVANHEKDLERTRERVKALGDVRTRESEERSSMLSENDGLAAEREQLASELEAARSDRAGRERALEGLELRLGSAARELARREAGLGDLRVEHAARVEKRDRLAEAAERAQQQVNETREWMTRRETEIEEADVRRQELADSIAERERELAAELQREEEARVSQDDKRDRFEREAASVRGLEEQVRGLRTEMGRQREALQQAELAARERELKLEHLESSVRERWGVDLARWTPEATDSVVAGSSGGDESDAGGEPEEGAESGATSDLMSLPRDERSERLRVERGRLEALGEVNLGAIEEHDELRERFRFLGEQKEDLEKTLASLREAIQKINRTSRKRFKEAFEAVASRFAEIFPRLFNGGKASLELSDSDDVLEAGVEIMAMPPGKRLQNVNLLSGGEKTMTALSLLIALFQVRPSPFFLLDEVDAPLDDANVGRFNEIVKEMSEASQFLLITHNKRTIEVADLLYGVTMENRGVSTLVSVEIHGRDEVQAANG